MSVHVTLRSYHIDRETEYNEWNWGGGLGYDLGPIDVEVGAYYNSEWQTSLYGTIVKSVPENNTFGISAALGIVSGYDDGLQPMAAGAGYLGDNPRLRILFLPTSGGVFSTQIRYEP